MSSSKNGLVDAAVRVRIRSNDTWNIYVFLISLNFMNYQLNKYQ